ncbi:MAG: 50S ribosomal protein L29 [Acidiferrobacterales bacterium]|nr:50S ribosomal protein L29 [Acidiferrobacterales bacterium]
MNTAKELRSKAEVELREEIIHLRRQQLETRIQQSTGQFSNTAKFKEYRKDIARVKTVLNEMSNK